MSIATQVAPVVDVFAGARAELEALFTELSGAGAASHVMLGEMITTGLARVATRTFQGHLDALFEKERAEVKLWSLPEGSEIRARQRQLETEHDRVIVRRHGIRLPDAKEARFPLDEALSLPPELYALSLREEVAHAAAAASFDRSVEHVDRTTDGHVPKRQVEDLVVRAAADFEAFYETRTPPANETLSAEGLQVGSADCKGVTMRPEALRDATRKEAEAAAADAVRGDPMAQRKARRCNKRMAVVTAVWEQEPHVRTAEDVLERLHRDPKGRRRRPRSIRAPRPQNKRVAASLTRSNAEGVADMFDEMQRRDPRRRRKAVILVDGDEKQLDNVKDEARKRGMIVTIVVDVIHVIHYLHTIAMLLCAKDRKRADAWVAHILGQLLTRHPLDVVATIRQTATNRKLAAEERTELEAAVDYLRKNSLHIEYSRFLAEGLPIATGVIEGACRHLIQDRLGITGARWGLAHAEAILKLRAIRTSGDWDEYWRFHLAKEQARNHPQARAA